VFRTACADLAAKSLDLERYAAVACHAVPCPDLTSPNLTQHDMLCCMLCAALVVTLCCRVLRHCCVAAAGFSALCYGRVSS
jgi:hypothetical protein